MTEASAQGEYMQGRPAASHQLPLTLLVSEGELASLVGDVQVRRHEALAHCFDQGKRIGSVVEFDQVVKENAFAPRGGGWGVRGGGALCAKVRQQLTNFKSTRRTAGMRRPHLPPRFLPCLPLSLRPSAPHALTANTTMLMTSRNVEVVVAPFLEARVGRWVVRVTNLQRGVTHQTL
jgi:hypothetical protein